MSKHAIPLSPPQYWRRRLALLGAAVVLCLAGAVMIFGQEAIREAIGWYYSISAVPMPFWVLAAFLVLYAVLIALPFVPGIEVGLALLMLNGPSAAPLVYLGTVAGLTLAFAIGWNIPQTSIARIFALLRLRRAARWLAEEVPHDPKRRLARLRRHLPKRLAPHFLSLRYVLLALLINLPGSAAIGGGGGILLVAGLSRLFAPRATILTIAIAVAPVPLAVWLLGAAFLETVPL